MQPCCSSDGRVDEAERNRKGADPIEPAFEQRALSLFDGPGATVSAPNRSTNPLRRDAMLPGIGQCLRRSPRSEDTDAIHAARLTLANHLVCIELQNTHPRQGRQPVEGNVRTARLARQDRVPKAVDIVTERRDDAQTGDCDASLHRGSVPDAINRRA